jgi:hypothetical protein
MAVLLSTSVAAAVTEASRVSARGNFGLKFERRKELDDVLVIDSVERPTPD